MLDFDISDQPLGIRPMYMIERTTLRLNACVCRSYMSVRRSRVCELSAMCSIELRICGSYMHTTDLGGIRLDGSYVGLEA
jgi:hypothetical protein